MSSRLSNHSSAWNNSAHAGHTTTKFDIWGFLKKYIEKIQVLLKSDKNNRYFTWRLLYIVTVSRWIILWMRNVSDESCRENQNTHFISNNFYPKIMQFMGQCEKYGTAR